MCAIRGGLPAWAQNALLELSQVVVVVFMVSDGGRLGGKEAVLQAWRQTGEEVPPAGCARALSCCTEATSPTNLAQKNEYCTVRVSRIVLRLLASTGCGSAGAGGRKELAPRCPGLGHDGR